MHLNTLEVLNFKNHEAATWQFSPGINCIVGPNGTGKTNLLDAVHYLSMTKSAFHATDRQSIRHNAAFFMCKGEFERSGESLLVNCSLKMGQKKVFTLDRKAHERMSDHIGILPSVLSVPEDTDLVKGGSELRRRHFDATFAQIDRDYLGKLLQYNQLIKQRNQLLKQFAEHQQFDAALLDTFDARIVPLAQTIAANREHYLKEMIPFCYDCYAQLTQQQEAVGLFYRSEARSESFPQHFAAARRNDLVLQRTQKGVHRDDYEFELGGYSIKKYGSQGQQKSFVISLKLAQFSFIKQKLGISPILLLDDIFDKLDDARIGQLLSIIQNGAFGQIFITDARPERSRELLKGSNKPVAFFEMGDRG